MSSARERAEDLIRRNLQYRTKFLGTDYMPSGLVEIPELDQGPKGPLENLQSWFGMRPEQDINDLIRKAEGNYSLYRRAENQMLEDEYEKAKRKIEEQKAESKLQTAEDRAQRRSDSAYDLEQSIAAIERIEQGRAKSALEQIAASGEQSTRQSIAQLEALYPYLDAAGKKAIERNLSASMRFKAFKEQLPSNVQAIMESKQRQKQLASDAFAREAQALATQQQAATGFAGLGMQRRFG